MPGSFCTYVRFHNTDIGEDDQKPRVQVDGVAVPRVGMLLEMEGALFRVKLPQDYPRKLACMVQTRSRNLHKAGQTQVLFFAPPIKRSAPL